MTRLSSKKVQALINVGHNGESSVEKGTAFEDLICYLFEKVAGISETERNVRNDSASQEIDVAFWNDRHPQGFPFLPFQILVECKNWTKPVGAEQVAWFDKKLRDAATTFGIIFAANGITGGAKSRKGANDVVSDALKEGRDIIVVTADEVAQLKSTTDLVILTKKKILKLKASRMAF